MQYLGSSKHETITRDGTHHISPTEVPETYRNSEPNVVSVLVRQVKIVGYMPVLVVLIAYHDITLIVVDDYNGSRL